MTKTMRTIFCLTIIFASMCSTTLYPANSEEIPLNQYGIRSTNPYVVDRFVLNGKTIDKIIVPGPPSPPPGFVRPSVANLPIPNPAAGINVLTNVPASTWAFGCSATSAAMMFGYYDNSGFTRMYSGPTNGGVFPMTNAIWGSVVINTEAWALNPLSATRYGLDGRTIKGHVDDYWIQYLSSSPDPFITGGWTEHVKGECTGDYMGTNQSLVSNVDGSTTFYNYSSGSPLYDYTGAEPGGRDGCHGLKLFVESRGYAVQSLGNFNQYIYGYNGNTLGFTFANFKAEIDAGRPVLIQVEGHSMLGFGYDDAGLTVYIHDTWDYSDHTMTWGGYYSGMKHYAVAVCRLASVSNIRILSPNGGESWQAGTTHDITWNSSVPISAVKIELSFNGGSLWSTIITSTPNDGSYSWDIVKVPSLNCFMRISDVLGTSSDTSDAPFVLQSPPSLTDNYFILPVKWTDTPFGSGGWYVGDYDGDGRSDLLRYVLDGTRNEVLLSTGSAFAAGTNWLTADHGADGWHVGDYNGDGRSDLMRYVPGVSGAQVFLSNGSNFIYNGSWTRADNGSDGWYIGDFDGDGRDDIMRYVPGVSGADVFLSDGMKFNYSGNWSGAGNGADGWYVGDFNGDGRSDLMRYYPGVSGGEVFLSDGTKFTYSGSWTGAGNGDNGWYLGKFSGTARTDIMRYVLLLSGADVFLNTGAGFTYDGSWTPAGRGDNDWHVGDFNGDGRDDLMRSIVGVTGADVLLSTTISGSSSSATPMAIQANRGKARWLNDVPAEKPLSAEEQTLLEGIKARIAAGEEVTIYQVQKEYEKLTGRLCTRAGIMKLLKQQQWDNLYKPKADDLLQ